MFKNNEKYFLYNININNKNKIIEKIKHLNFIKNNNIQLIHKFHK